MPKRILNLITYTLTIGVCVFLVWLSLKDLTPEHKLRIQFALKKAHYELLVPIVLMGLLSHWSRAVRWRYLMQPLGLNPGLRNTFFAVLIGYLANMFLPRFGEVIKCTILSRYEKVPADQLIGTIITERAFDLLCLLLIFVLAIGVQTNLAMDFLSDLWQRNARQPGEGPNLILWGSLLLLVFLIWVFRHKLAGMKWWRKLREMMHNILQGILSFRTMKNKPAFIFHTLLIWSLYFGMILLGFQSIEETRSLGVDAGLSVLSFGSVGMIVTPGGIGAYTLLVEQIVKLYGMEDAISLAISWIIWLVPTLIILLGGGVALVLMPLLHNRNKHAIQTGNHPTENLSR